MAEAGINPTEHEAKLLRYLLVNGTTERRKIMLDCSSEKSLVAARAKYSRAGLRSYNGSNGAAPMIVANWMKRLVKAGLVVDKRRSDSLHDGYSLTPKGRDFAKDMSL